MRAHEVMLVSMPWAAVEQPSLQLGILAAALGRANIDVGCLYANLEFAARIGLDAYRDYGSFHNDLSDWMFAASLFGPAPRRDAGLLTHARARGVSVGQLAEVQRLRDAVPDFLAWCLAVCDWSQVRVVGFTTTMLQPMPALALARALTRQHPHLKILLGGAGCQGPMGASLHRNFEFIDGVVDGEADTTIVPLVQALLAGERPDVAGLAWREHGQITARPPAKTNDLRDYPRPCYDDYFAQLAGYPSTAALDLRLPFEGSRGCWWAVRNHCKFCGLNGEVVAQRARPVAAVIDELREQRARHGCSRFVATDNILAPEHVVPLAQALADQLPGVQLFFEVRAVMQRAHLRGLADAGVLDLQPGIESLIAEVLTMVDKGTTPLANLCFLRRAAEFGVRAHWNFLYGFPGERREWYEAVLPKLHRYFHLAAPDVIQFSLQRFSPYFEQPERHEIEILGARAAARLIWQLPEPEIRALSFDLDFAAPGLENRAEIGARLREVAASWSAVAARLDARAHPDGRATIMDSRPLASAGTHVLGPTEGSLLRALERPTTAAAVSAAMLEHDPAAYLRAGGQRGLARGLARLETLALIEREGDRWMALVVPDEPSFWLVDRPVDRPVDGAPRQRVSLPLSRPDDAGSRACQ